jgi:hypothetical protein
MGNKINTRSKRSPLWSHLIRFLMYNFIGALLPLMVSWTVRRISDISAFPGAYAPELLFFAIMISATALGDITDEVKIVGKAPTFQLVKGALLFGAIAIASVYGMYQYDTIVGPGNIAFRNNITNLTVVLASILFVTSLLAELLVAQIRGKAYG